MRWPTRAWMKRSSGSHWMTSEPTKAYDLAFLESALKEWRKLDTTIRDQFKARLQERLKSPKVPSARLHGAKNRYKIKLRTAGYRLVYEVKDHELLVLVIAVGKRENNAVYTRASGR